MNVEWDLEMEKPVPKTNEFAYFPNKETKLQESKLAYETKIMNSNYSNIKSDGVSWENKQTALFRRRIQKLCRGDVSRSVIILKCEC